MGHPSRYGPEWVVSSKSMTEGGDQCVHLAVVTALIREEFERERGVKLLADTTHVARDEHGNWLQLTGSEAWAFVRGAKAGNFDHLFDTPPVVDPAAPGTPAEGWPEKHMLEAAFGLLCSAQPHGVLNGEKAVEWSRAFERWRDAYHAEIDRQILRTEKPAPEWSCSA